MAFYVTFGPHLTELKELAAVAGLRWTIEECFQSAKGETGLDHSLAGLRARLKETQIGVASAKANKRSLSAVA